MAKKENAKSGKFLKKKKKRFPFLLVLLLILGLAAGGWWLVQGMDLIPGETIGPETTSPAETAAPAAPTAPAGFETTGPEETTEPVPVTRPAGDYELPQVYLDVLDRYARAISEGWDFTQCDENQISYMVTFRQNLTGLGYHTPDLDHNGVRELIISDGNVIYNMYTIQDDQLLCLISGAERNSYHLCQGGYIFNHGSNSAASYTDNIYYLKNGQLVLKESILFDGASEDAMWMLTREGAESPEPINGNLSQQIVDSYQRVSIPLTPFP